MTSSADTDQLASSEANWSGSTLFAKTGHVLFSKRRVKCPLNAHVQTTYVKNNKGVNAITHVKIYAQREMCCKSICPQLYACPYKMPRLERGITLTNLIHFFQSPSKFTNIKALGQIVFKISCSQEKHDELTDWWTDRWMNNPTKSKMPLQLRTNLFEVGGIQTIFKFNLC